MSNLFNNLLCVYGCGQQALFLNNKPCCSKSHNSCPEVIRKKQLNRAKQQVYCESLIDFKQPCSYGCNQPAKYIISKWKRLCCSKSHNSCPAVKKQKEILLKELTEKEILFCSWCRNTAHWLIGKEQTPCCSKSHNSCPAINKQKTKSFAEYEEITTQELCVYGCGQQARYRVGNEKSLCCSKSRNSCSIIAKKKAINYTPIETLELCGFGCNQQAKYKSKEGKLCCSNNHASCPAVDYKLHPIATQELCVYGCGQLAKYKSSTGILCCSSNRMGCEAILEKRIFTLVETLELCSYGCGQQARYKSNTSYCCSNHYTYCPEVVKKMVLSKAWTYQSISLEEQNKLCSGCNAQATYKHWHNKQWIYDCRQDFENCPGREFKIHPSKLRREAKYVITIPKNSTKIETQELCVYGCGQQAKWLVTVNKRLCCTSCSRGCPAIRDKFETTMLQRYGTKHALQNYSIWAKQQKAGFKHREYTLPSGRIVQLRGYEPQALTYLLKSYREEQIQFESEISAIRYNESHVYHPDFYIPDEQLVIEVKSPETYERYFKKNMSKAFGVLKTGKKILFLVIFPDQHILEIPVDQSFLTSPV